MISKLSPLCFDPTPEPSVEAAPTPEAPLIITEKHKEFIKLLKSLSASEKERFVADAWRYGKR